jgi:hypothetical protein
MITEGSWGLRFLGEIVRNEVQSKCSDAFTATDVRMIAMMSDLLSEDFDRAADVLVKEREALEAFFIESLPNLPEALALRVKERLAHGVDDLRIATLGLRADADLSVFIALHETVEAACQAGEPWATSLEDAAWRLIGDYAEHRAYRSKT